MFTPLKKALASSLRKKGITEKIEQLSQKEVAERAASEITKLNIRALAIRKGTLFLKVPSALAASEVRLKEKRIILKLKESKIYIDKIKCAP